MSHSSRAANTHEDTERGVKERIAGLERFNEILFEESERHRKANETLLERLELVARATSDLIFDWDITSDRVWYNRASESYYGYPNDEKDGARESWMERVHPQDREWLGRKFQRAIEAGEQFWSAEYRILLNDGCYVTVVDRGYLI